MSNSILSDQYNIVHFGLQANPHGFNFGFHSKRTCTNRVEHLFIYQTFLCLISNVGLNLLSHIFSLKIRTTLISYVSFGELSSVPPCTSNRRASFENVSPTTSHHRFHDLMYVSAKPRYDTNCQDLFKSMSNSILSDQYNIIHFGLQASPHSFTFGFHSKRPRTNRVEHLFIYQTFLCLSSNVRLNLLSHKN